MQKHYPLTPNEFLTMPPLEFGGSKIARAALEVAICELKAGARELGSENSGPWIRKYLNGLAPEGSSWCAAFVSYCFANSGYTMPFNYSVSAREMFNQFMAKEWMLKSEQIDSASPGDIVFWWRIQPDSWQGHVGLIHHRSGSRIFTIEGNRTDKVEGFSYKLDKMPRFLGIGRVPDSNNAKV